jgi:adenylate cyclase
MTEANVPESVGAKSDNAPAQPSESPARISDRLRHRLRTTGAAIASLAAVGAVVSGLTGYWSTWKLVKTELFHDGQSVQKEAVARPDVAPRLSLVVLPFANLNNDPEQDYFADAITTDLTTDLAQMPAAFVIGRGTAV